MSAGRCFSRGRIELAIGLFVLAVIVAAGVGMTIRRNTPVAPGLVVAPGTLDFGTAWEQPALRHAFTVTNPTDAPVRVTGIKTGCGCTTIAPQSFTVPPGGRQEVAATLNLTDRAGGSFTVEVMPQLAHQPPGNRTVWTLRGEVRPNPIIISEPTIDFGDDYVFGEPVPSREVKVTLDGGLQFDGLRAAVQDGKGQVETEAVGSGKWRLTVTPAEDLPLGPFELVVRIEAAGDRSSPVPFREVKVAGTVRDEIAAWPAAVNFGALDVGATSREYVILASHAGRPFEVTRIELPEGVTVEPAPDQLGDGSRTFVVTATVTQRGDHQDLITFHVRRPDPPPGGSTDLTIPLEVRYYGTIAVP